MAVYNKKDFENFLNKDKIRKQKIKKRIITLVSIVLAVAILTGLVFLLLQDRGIYIKEDNYTEAIDFAIQKFANEKVGSFDVYPRLSYNYKTSPRPDNPVEDKNDNDIYIEYNKENGNGKDKNKEESVDDTTTDNKNNTNQQPTNKPQENTPVPPQETIIYEYDHFFAIAGKGNYPGYGISGPTFIQDIRKEVCLAIKAYTTMPLAGGTDKGNYRLQYYDKQYDYVYFFLTGEVRKVDKSYLKRLDAEVGKNSYDVYNFWISLTEDKSSNIAKSLLNSDKPIYTIIVSDLNGKTIDNVTVSYIAGSYIETIKTSDNAILIFNDVPLGDARLQVEREGYIGFPNAIAYKEYEEIMVENNVEYKGKHISNPLRVKLQQSSLGKCSFSYSSFFYDYNENKWTVEKDYIEGHYTVMLKNTETEETIEQILNFKGEDIYLCDYFEEIKKGVYDIEIYPASDNLGALTINKVYINEYGMSDKGYLTEEEEYVFSFSTSEYVKVFFDIQDNTTYGLEGRKGIHNMYQMIETKATQEQKVEILLKDVESGQTYTQVLTNEDGRLVGNVNVPQNKLYDVYVATSFGDVLIQDDLRMRMGNYKFSASIEDKDLPQCMTDIYFIRNDTATMKIVNTANSKEVYTVALTEGENNKYKLNYNEPISSGYYYLYVYKSEKVQETYLLLISEKSNNYTVEFQ